MQVLDVNGVPGYPEAYLDAKLPPLTDFKPGQVTQVSTCALATLSFSQM